MFRASVSLFIAICLASANAQVGQSDVKFVVAAAQGNRSEVVLGRLASQLGSTDPIRQFGGHMVRDHSGAYSALRRLAAKKRITIPARAKDEDQKLYERLSKLTGHEFDVEYQKAMIEDHEKDVAEFERQTTKAGDPQIKAYAAKYLPRLREHLRMIREIKL